MSLLEEIEPFIMQLIRGTITRTDCYFLDDDISDNKKRTATFLTLIGKETYSLLNPLTAPDKPSSKKVDELNTILFEHFEPKPIVTAERYQLYSRVQQDEETRSTLLNLENVPYIASLRT